MPNNDEIEIICKRKDKWEADGDEATSLVKKLNSFQNFSPKIADQQSVKIKVTIIKN